MGGKGDLRAARAVLGPTAGAQSRRLGSPRNPLAPRFVDDHCPHLADEETEGLKVAVRDRLAGGSLLPRVRTLRAAASGSELGTVGPRRLCPGVWQAISVPLSRTVTAWGGGSPEGGPAAPGTQTLDGTSHRRKSQAQARRGGQHRRPAWGPLGPHLPAPGTERGSESSSLSPRGVLPSVHGQPGHVRKGAHP